MEQGPLISKHETVATCQVKSEEIKEPYYKYGYRYRESLN